MRWRVYQRRRIGALLGLVALLLVGAVLTGLVSLPLGGAGSSGSQAEQEVSKLDAHSSNSRTVEDRGPGAAKLAEEATRKLNPEGGAKPTEKLAEDPEDVAGEPLDVLVLGVDRRLEGDYIEGSRADAIMVARVFPDAGHVKVLSIPRDLFVEIEPGVEDRINAAYAYGGVSQTAATVERLTGISVDRYAVVDFQGFENIVDAVDGVTVEVKGEMPRGWHMEGKETLDGERALLYARYRGTPGGDLDRIARQQQVVSALHDKMLSWGSLSDLPEIVRIMRDNTETDLGFVESLSLGHAVLRAGDGGHLSTLQLKGTPTTTPDGRQVLMPDREENERLVRGFEQPASS